MMGGSIRSFCVVVLLAWTVGSAEVFVADQRQSAGGLKGTKPREQPLADIPREFGFLFLSPEQLDREAAKRPTYWEDLGLPGALPSASSLLGPQISDFEGSVRIFEFAKLSYLLHRARFLQLPDRSDCSSCPADGLYVTLSVAAGGKTKSVTDHAFATPPELWAIQQAFDSVSKSIKWTQK